MKSSHPNFQNPTNKRISAKVTLAHPAANSNIHLFSKKMKKFAALAGHQHFRRALKQTEHCTSPSQDMGNQFSSNKYILHRQEKSLPKESSGVNNSGSYDNGCKISNTSDVFTQPHNNKKCSNDSEINIKELHKRNSWVI